MATTIVSLSTSSFAVAGHDRLSTQRPAAFEAFCDSWGLAGYRSERDNGVELVDVFAEGCESVFDETTPAVVVGRNFAADLASHIADGWVVVVATRHRERGWDAHWHAEAVTNQGVIASADSDLGDDFELFCSRAATLGRYAAVPVVTA